MRTRFLHRTLLLFPTLLCGVWAAYSQVQLDFGDAPDTPYPTTLKNNGARHGINEGLRLGARIDAEPDGQPSPDALDDDITPTVTSDDEDGVVFSSSLVPGQTANVVVTVFGQGLLSAWVDFNINGSWADNGEQIFTDLPLAGGAHTLSFLVPYLCQTRSNLRTVPFESRVRNCPSSVRPRMVKLRTTRSTLNPSYWISVMLRNQTMEVFPQRSREMERAIAF